MAERPDLAAEVVAKLWPRAHRHAGEPCGWIRERLGAHLWSGQERIARALVDHRYVAVPSGHGVGKDWLAARLACWWLDTRSDAFVVSSAPTGPQLSGALWREIARAHRRAELGGSVTTGQIPAWRMGGELVGWGRKPADLADPEEAASAFQGIHSRFVLVILDEASGIPDWLWDAAASLMTSAESRLLAIGNPLDPAGRFARVCAPGSGWHTIRLSVFDTPAFTGEAVPAELLDVLPSEVWVDERRRDWGESSPMWVARVLGEFPPVSRDTLIAPHLIRAAHERERAAEVLPPPRLGVDVARSGSDRTVVAAVWPSGHVRVVHDAAGADTMETAGHVLRLLHEAPFGPPERVPTTAAVDVVGLGAGVFDRLREQGANVAPFNSASRAQDPVRFVNRRAEAFWALREALERGELDLDPRDDELAAQLGSLRWRVNSRGQILIESKDEMRARGLPSPDRADSVAMGLAPRSAAAFVAAEASGDEWWREDLGAGRITGDSVTGDLLDMEW